MDAERPQDRQGISLPQGLEVPQPHHSEMVWWVFYLHLEGGEQVENNYCIYAHISPSNKAYIGITCQKPNRRWHGGSGYREQPKFYNAIKKYGWDNFKHIILFENLTESQACELETKLIEQ